MSKSSSDRHKDHSRQYNVRVPNALLDAFNAACLAQGLKPAIVVRNLMEGFVAISAESAEAAAS
ncbi:hypothetical protein [Paraburkholderia sp. A3RO-2L]|jgi:hypothetical protein|uniref:hypothetical protein n=1 Tax=unclassified Paraburkholderia TaxID=2615204 RepID=UPI0032FF7E17|nr:hypothetical protein [Burkholderia vietnamiensis]